MRTTLTRKRIRETLPPRLCGDNRTGKYATKFVPSMFASLVKEKLQYRLKRLWILRLCDVAVLVQAVLGQAASAELDAKLQELHHHLLGDFCPCFVSTRGNNAVEGVKGLCFVTEADVL